MTSDVVLVCMMGGLLLALLHVTYLEYRRGPGYDWPSLFRDRRAMSLGGGAFAVFLAWGTRSFLDLLTVGPESVLIGGAVAYFVHKRDDRTKPTGEGEEVSR